jgi:hypothetical protein
MNSFDFHSIVGLQLDTEDVWAAEFYRSELAAHAGDPAEDVPVVDLTWRHSWLPRSPGADYQLQIHKRLARWYFRIGLTASRVTIDCVGNRTAIPLAWHMLVEPSMRYLVSTSGSLMLHGAAIVLADKCLVLTGKGGAGKTSTSSVVLRHDPSWKLHSDDYVFLSRGRISQAFGTRAHAYLDLLRWLPELRSRLSFAEKAQIGLFGWLRRLSGERIKWPMRLQLERLWPGRELSMQAELGAVVLLGERTAHELQIRQLPAEARIPELIEMNFNEAHHFIQLVRKYLGIQRADAEVEKWRERETRALTEILLDVPVYELQVPRQLGSNSKLTAQLVTELKAVVERG